MKFLERFFQKIFVGVYKGKIDFNIYVVEVSVTGKKSSYYENFAVDDRDSLSRFLISLQKKSPVIYISFLDTDMLQGVIPTCSRQEAKKFPCVLDCKDFDDLAFHCYGDNWNIFTSRSGILDFQESYESIGYDYLFSPFLLIKPLFQNSFPDETTFYIFVENEFTTLTILNGEKLLYGRYVKNIDDNLETIENVKSELENSVDTELNSETEKSDNGSEKSAFEMEFDKSIVGKDDSEHFDDSLADIKDTLDDLDDLGGGDDFKASDELSELDSLNDIGAFDDGDKSPDFNKLEDSVETDKGLEGPKSGNDSKSDNDEPDLAKEIDSIVDEVAEEGVDVHQGEEELPVVDKNFIYQQIKKSIREFYESDLYEPDFIEKAYLITNIDFEEEFSTRLSEEMGFIFEQVEMDTPKLITKLAIDEAGYEI